MSAKGPLDQRDLLGTGSLQGRGSCALDSPGPCTLSGPWA